MPPKEKDATAKPEKASPKTKKVPASKRKAVALDVNKRLKPSDNKRKVVKVARFAEDVEEKVAKSIVIPKGKGKKLSDIPNVAALISKRTRSDTLLKTLHAVLLGRVSKKVALKDNLLAFNGVAYDDTFTRAKLETKLEALTVGKLKDLLAFFGQEPKGKKEELVPKLADFLEKPKASDAVYEISSSGKAKTKAAAIKSARKPGKKAKKDPNAPKRALSAYFFFIKDKRDDIKKKHPKDGITEIAKKLGEAWKKLSATDKKPFQAKADKDKERYAKEVKKYKTKA